eukprot:SAG31_NODE_9188_length_1319_cov_1.692623_2_plen_236_part_00
MGPPPEGASTIWSESVNGTVVLSMCGCTIASIAGHVGSADPTLGDAHNNLQTIRLYLPANYIADASVWLQNQATGAPDKTEWFNGPERFPSELYYRANNTYPPWQQEYWQKEIGPPDHAFTMELVKYFKQSTALDTEYSIAPANTMGTVTYGGCPAGQRCTVSGKGAETQHCSTATVFGGAPTLFNNGLYFCVTELSASSKFVEIFAFAEFCLWVGVYSVTIVGLPIVAVKNCLC